MPLTLVQRVEARQHFGDVLEVGVVVEGEVLEVDDLVAPFADDLEVDARLAREGQQR